MNLREIKIGMKLEFELVNNLGDKISQTYASQLLDITDIDKMAIAAPIHESRVLFIPIGAKVRVFFFHKRDGLLSFPASILSKEKRDNIAALIIQTDGDFEKIQRRKHYRLDCNIAASYRVCGDDETDDFLRSEIRKNIDSSTLESRYMKAITKNISGSGACIVTLENIPKGSMLELILWLNGKTCVRAAGKSIRTSEIETPREKKFETGLHFTEITDQGQDHIIKFVFEQQKHLLKRQIEK